MNALSIADAGASAATSSLLPPQEQQPLPSVAEMQAHMAAMAAQMHSMHMAAQTKTSRGGEAGADMESGARGTGMGTHISSMRTVSILNRPKAPADNAKKKALKPEEEAASIFDLPS